jgi:hypothetical protein
MTLAGQFTSNPASGGIEAALNPPSASAAETDPSLHLDGCLYQVEYSRDNGP